MRYPFMRASSVFFYSQEMHEKSKWQKIGPFTICFYILGIRRKHRL